MSAEYVSYGEPLSCTEADTMRATMAPESSLTNYVGGEVLNPYLPARTETTWVSENGKVRMRDTLDSTGCRHVLMVEATP